MQAIVITVVRVALLIGYVFLAHVVSLFFLRSDGFGSHAPPAIFFSWGILPGEFGLVPEVVGLFLITLIYMLSLLALTTVCVRSRRLVIAISPALIHVAGVPIALSLVTQHMEHAGWPTTPGFLAASYIIAAFFTAGYLLGDWCLARFSTRELTQVTDHHRQSHLV